MKEIHVIQEQSRLHQTQLNSLGCDAEACNDLVSLGVLRVEKSDDFRADFVGVAATGKESIQFPPKYLSSLSERTVSSEMKLIVRTLRKYARRIPPGHNDATHLRLNPETNSVSGFAQADALITDFLKYGLYRNRIIRRKLNGKGAIDWSKTVSLTNPYFSRGKPIYSDVVKRISAVDSAHWVTRLHLSAIDYAIKHFGSLLGYQALSLDHESVAPLSPVPSQSFVKTILQRELSTSYSERTIRLLRLLQSWYLGMGSSTGNSLTLFGISSFHTVWEEICGALFSNKMSSYQSLIPKPEWTNASGDRQQASTLLPDIVSDVTEENGTKTFLLLDAKYYRTVMPPNLANHPGVADVTKQLFYDQVLSSKVKTQGFDRIFNCFLFPKSGGKLFECAGQVKLEGVSGGPIAVFYLNASEVMTRYIESTALTEVEKQQFVRAASEI